MVPPLLLNAPKAVLAALAVVAPVPPCAIDTGTLTPEGMINTSFADVTRPFVSTVTQGKVKPFVPAPPASNLFCSSTNGKKA